MQPLSNTSLNSTVFAGKLGSTDDLADFVARHPSLFVITGAGISKASGIPTYRDEIGTWKSNKPIQHAEFIRSEAVRQRYWARSFGGWPNVGNAKPNKAHRGLAELEQRGVVTTLVTQNIDRLHQKAGHRKVTDLHGRLDQVVCMDCGALTARSEVQEWLWQHNPHLEDMQIAIGPDGDADVADDHVRRVKVPDCGRCGGMLKPNVVFYGSSVSKEVVNYLYDRLQQASAVLVIGSSLMVYSAFRFCKQAAADGKPLACINEGLTRADNLFELKVPKDCGETLTALASSLG